jgi:hypothetical protein
MTSIQELSLLLHEMAKTQPNKAKDNIVALARLTSQLLFHRHSSYLYPVDKNATSLLHKFKILKILLEENITYDVIDRSNLLAQFNLAIQVLEEEVQRANSTKWLRLKISHSDIPRQLIEKFCISELRGSSYYLIDQDIFLPPNIVKSAVKYIPKLMDKEKETFQQLIAEKSLKLQSQQTINIFKDFICEPPFYLSEGHILKWTYFYNRCLVCEGFIRGQDRNFKYSLSENEIEMFVKNPLGYLEEILVEQEKFVHYYKNDIVFGLNVGGHVWGGYQNYGHLLCDQIASLILYEKLGLSCEIFVPHITDRHWEIFNLLKIPKEKILVKQEQKFKYLITGWYQKDLEIVKFYRKLRESIVVKRPDILSAYRSSYIYISRRHSRRAMSNEVEVEELMKSLGFSIVYAEKLSFEEQAMLMHHTSVLVTQWGAGILNSVMCHPNTSIVEIYPPHVKKIHDYAYPIYVLGELHYYPLMGNQITNGWEMELNKLKGVIGEIMQ